MEIQNGEFTVEIDSLKVGQTYAGCYVGSMSGFNPHIVANMVDENVNMFELTKMPTDRCFRGVTKHTYASHNVLPDDWTMKQQLPPIQFTVWLTSDQLVSTDNGHSCGSHIHLTGFCDNIEDVFQSIRQHLEKLDWNDIAENYDL